MRTKNASLVMACAFALVGCVVDADKDKSATGTTAAEAAEALTKAVSFEGGQLVNGLLPEGTSSDASLLPFESDTLEAGAAALMSFDVTPEDASVSAALVHFKGAKSHFKVKSGSFRGARPGTGDGGTASGGAGASRHITLSYAVNDTVCAQLCDTTYELKVSQALVLPKGRISDHASTTVTLDCRDTGDHAKCGPLNKAAKAKQPDAGVDAGPMAVAMDGAMTDQDASPTTKNTDAETATSDGTCQSMIPGVYAMKVELDVWWIDGVNDPSAPLVDPGRSKLNLYFRTEINGVDDTTLKGTSTLHPCGAELPVIFASANCSAIGIEFPDDLWDEAGIPDYVTDSEASGVGMDDILTVVKTKGLLGLSITDGNAFPTYDETGTFTCPEGVGEQCFRDHDGDGMPGITVSVRDDMTQITGPGYGCNALAPTDLSNKFTFYGAPLGLGAFAPTATNYAKQAQIGLMFEAGGSSQLGAGCKGGTGSVESGDTLPARIIHCTLKSGAPCTVADEAFLDKNSPNFHILKAGAVPPSTFMFPGAFDAARDALLDRSTSAGPRSSMVRLGDVGTKRACADIRGASFSAFE